MGWCRSVFCSQAGEGHELLRQFRLTLTGPGMTGCLVSKAAQLQEKAATLPDPVAAEVLDFLEFLTAKRAAERASRVAAASRLRGAFKGRLSSSSEFSADKADEIRLEE